MRNEQTMGLAKMGTQNKNKINCTKKIFCFCILMVTFLGCTAGDNEGKNVSVSGGKVPLTIIEALDICIEDCINKHCSGTKLVLVPSGKLEVFETDNLTDDICTEKANQAIAAKDIIAGKLGKFGGTTVTDPGAGEVKGGTFGPDTAHPGAGYFWAVEYIQCRGECLNRFRLSVLE